MHASKPLFVRETGFEAAGAALLAAIARAARAVAAPIVAARRRRRLFDELSSLDDRMLKDIGVTRAEIPYIVSGEWQRLGREPRRRK